MQCPRVVVTCSVRVVVTFTESEMHAACGASVTRRDTSTAYMPASTIESVLSDVMGDFSVVSIISNRMIS